MKKVNIPRKLEEPHRTETDIVYVLAKLKGKVVRDRIRVMEFLRDYDRNNENVIIKENFVRGLGSCRLGLTPTEVETLVTVFTSPMRHQYVDYKLVFSKHIIQGFGNLLKKYKYVINTYVVFNIKKITLRF